MLSLAMPVVMGIAMFALTRSPFSLLFVVMGPVMMVGGWNDNRRTRKRQLADESARFEDGFARLTAELAAKRPEELGGAAAGDAVGRGRHVRRAPSRRPALVAGDPSTGTSVPCGSGSARRRRGPS